MTGPACVSVLGVRLPADELADMLQQRAHQLLLSDRRRRRGDGPAVRVEPLVEAARRLRLHANAQLEPVTLPAEFVTCEVFAGQCGVTPSTVRRQAIGGRIEGAVKIAGRWMIPADAPGPTDRRRRANRPG